MMFRSKEHLYKRKRMPSEPDESVNGNTIEFGDGMNNQTKQMVLKKVKNTLGLFVMALVCMGFTVALLKSPSATDHNIWMKGRRRAAPPSSIPSHVAHRVGVHAGLGDNASFAPDPASATAMKYAKASKRKTQSYTPAGRRFAHFCYSRVHGKVGTHILKNEMGYQSVDAALNSTWTVMYGGYPHCSGEVARQNWDWKMERGLNLKMNERGWNKLKSHQVYHPCMGCNKSYCQKRELCKILRDYVDPSLCYVLPEDMDRLISDMNADKEQVPWVLKRDSSYEHIHMGRGVSYVTSPQQLPKSETLARGMHLIQRWNEPFLGAGVMRRKSEVRIYLAITSVYPLRAYAHNEVTVNIASTLYTNATEAVHERCMFDTHANNNVCTKYPNELEERFFLPRQMKFYDYVDMVGMTPSQGDSFINEAHELLSTVLNAGHSALDEHYINRGIEESGASCFSHMRADVGITREGKPFLFEIAEFPGLHVLHEVHMAPTRDLFCMFGLDDFPVPPEERQSFEKANLGGWRILPSAESLRRSGISGSKKNLSR